MCAEEGAVKMPSFAIVVLVAMAMCPMALGRSYTYLAYDQLRDALYDLQTTA